MNASAIVLNLHRRPDRLDRFQKFYTEFGPNLPLTIFEAIDGSVETEFNRVPVEIINSISDVNDFGNKNSIRATAYSHLMIWKTIAEGNNEYGMIFEDDCYFREINNQLPEISNGSLKIKWPGVINDYRKELKNPKSILYFGVGDLLPIHTVVPSKGMLIAQESNHVTNEYRKCSYGSPNFKSPYVFSWLGLGGYVLSKIQAKYLLAVASRKPMKCAIDVWIKGLYEKNIVDIYLTVPLYGYFPNILDSDTARPSQY